MGTKQDSAVPVEDATYATVTLYPTTDLDRGIVAWDSQEDSCNPKNFPPARKWGLLTLVSGISFVTPLASSMFAPAATLMAEEFGETNNVVVSLSVSVFLLGFVVSCKLPFHTELCRLLTPLGWPIDPRPVV